VASLRDVPRVIRSSLGLVRASRILALLLVIEATASIGMVAFEVLFPVRLETLTGSTQAAAALMGPVSAAGWAAAGVGAALVARASRRLGPYRTSMALRVLQAATILGMALALGPVGVVVGFVAAYLVHGAFNPVHMTLVHDQVGSDTRATVLSLNSMVASAAHTGAAIGIGAVADTWSVPVAMIACAAACLVAVPPLIRARRLAAQEAPPPAGPTRDDDRVGLTTA
jgi:predicted MFS family arabinose efflux permease